MPRGRRLRAVVAVFALLAVLTITVEPAGAAARPNIVLILTDDQRWDTLRYMPTVAQDLAGRGVRFRNAVVVNPLCCPSRASLLTGQYSHTTGVYRNWPPHGGFASFRDSSTIATWLQEGGYRTAYVGKYLNGYRAGYVAPGWDRWVAFEHGYFNYTLTVDGGTRAYGDAPADYSTDVLAAEATSFIENTREPFFLVFAPVAPHVPATPAPRHANVFPDLEPWRPTSYDEADVSDKPAWVRSRLAITEEGRALLDEFRRSQLASLLAVDDAVRRILDTLAATGRLADTLIVYTSDNGLMWGEHRIGARKVAAYEESLRVPLVLRYDRLTTVPRVDRHLVANIDLAPTLAAVGGVAAPGVEGTSLLPFLSAPVNSWRRALLFERLAGHVDLEKDVPTYCGIRSGRFKYVVYATREEELYDLRADRLELANRARDPAFKRHLLGLRALVKARCVPPPPGLSIEWMCTVEGDAGANVLVGTARDDTICGRAGADAIHGGRGADVIRGALGSDGAHGGFGNDRLVGGPGRDRLFGEAGHDLIVARDGALDIVECGRGSDRALVDRFDRVAAGCEVVRGA